MAKRESSSVFQREDGFWGYRFVAKIDGKRIERRCCTDEHGNKFRTKREATAARQAAIVTLRTERTTKPKPARRLVKEVFEEFCTEGRKDRAYGTIRKQDSIWENHLRERFGNRYVDEISSADVVDYLSELYYEAYCKKCGAACWKIFETASRSSTQPGSGLLLRNNG